MPTVELQPVGSTQCPDATTISEARMKWRDLFCISGHREREGDTQNVSRQLGSRRSMHEKARS